jgi:hypothetical protein
MLPVNNNYLSRSALNNNQFTGTEVIMCKL